MKKTKKKTAKKTENKMGIYSCETGDNSDLIKQVAMMYRQDVEQIRKSLKGELEKSLREQKTVDFLLKPKEQSSDKTEQEQNQDKAEQEQSSDKTE